MGRVNCAFCVCACRPEEPGHVDASWALIAGSGKETFRGQQEEVGREAEGVWLWGANEGAARGGEGSFGTHDAAWMKEFDFVTSVWSFDHLLRLIVPGFVRRRKPRLTRRKNRRRGNVGQRMTWISRKTMRWLQWWASLALAHQRRATEVLRTGTGSSTWLCC